MLAVIVALFHSATSVGATGSIAISGKVTEQNGSGVASVSVYATNIGGSTVEEGPTTTASDGNYTLYVNAGTYDFHFDPQSGSGLAAVVDNNIAVVGNQTINIQPWSIS